MVIVLLADGFEEIEALTPIDVLRRGGVEVKSVGISGKNAVGAHNIKVECDLLPSEVDLSKIDAVILPGGMPGASNLDACSFTDTAIDAVLKRSGRIAAICAAPFILGKRGLLKGKKCVCYPGFEDQLEGGIITDDPFVTDGNITTAKGMGAAYGFAFELLTLLKSKEESDRVAASIFYNKKN